MASKPAKKIPTKREKAPPIDFSVDALQGEPAEPPAALIQAVNRAIEQIQAGAATVHLKGQTEHQCQVQLVPLFIEKAKAAGLDVREMVPGRLRVGKRLIGSETASAAVQSIPKPTCNHGCSLTDDS